MPSTCCIVSVPVKALVSWVRGSLLLLSPSLHKLTREASSPPRILDDSPLEGDSKIHDEPCCLAMVTRMVSLLTLW